MGKHSMGKHSLVAVIVALLHAGAVHAMPITFTAALSGAAENPPNVSPGTGFATVVYDNETHLLSVDVSFSGLVAGTTAAHIHCCAAPPANSIPATPTPTFPDFPLGVMEGTYDMTFDLTDPSSFSSAFIGGGTAAEAEAALAAGLLAGEAYLNIHTTAFSGGEIRGFLRTVPEPQTLSILGLALGMLIAARTRH